MDKAAVSQLRKCRSVIRASMTPLGIRVKELEGKSVDNSKVNVAQRLKEKLATLDSEFSTHLMPSLMQLTTKNLSKRNRKSSTNMMMLFHYSQPYCREASRPAPLLRVLILVTLKLVNYST